MGLTTIYAMTQLYSDLVNYMNSTTYLCLVLAVLCSLVVSRVRLALLHMASLNPSPSLSTAHAQLSKHFPLY